MTLLIAGLLLAAALVLIVLGAETLLSGVTKAASRFSISAFALTALLSGLELENIAAGIAANLAGFPGAALGTSLGGAVFLALAVTGATAVIAPIRWALPKAAAFWICVSPLPLAALAWDGEVSRLDGALLALAFLPIVAGLARAGVDLDDDDDDDHLPGRVRRLHPLLRIALGLGLMTLGGNLLSAGMRGVVSRIPGGATLLGNTVIAAAVEGEEIVRVAVPSRRGRPDVAVAGIGGTIVHFLTLNAGIIALVHPMPVDAVTHRFYLPAAVIAPVVCGTLLATRQGAGRTEGIVLLALYAAFIALSIRFAGGS